MPRFVDTRVLVLSDTHAALPRSPLTKDCVYRTPLPEADVAIHTGDLTLTGTLAEHKAALTLLRSLKAPIKIVIPGNHDLTLDEAYYAVKGELWGPQPRYTSEQLQEIRELYTGPDAVAHGIVYIEEGVQSVELPNGAQLTVYASCYTPEFCQWAFAYPRSQDRFNPPHAECPVPSFDQASTTNVDVLITHGPPHGILDLTVPRHSHVGCPYLMKASERARPLMHCFGHIHEGWGAMRRRWTEDDAGQDQVVSADQDRMIEERAAYADATDLVRGAETLFVNSAIMTLSYKPLQAPWVVDLRLKAASGGIQGRHEDVSDA